MAEPSLGELGVALTVVLRASTVRNRDLHRMSFAHTIQRPSEISVRREAAFEHAQTYLAYRNTTLRPEL